MELKKIGAIISFCVAFAVGALFGGLATGSDIPVEYGPVNVPVVARKQVPVKMGSLVGKWAARWDRDFGDCDVEIDRISGNNFYGTLSKNGANIEFKGALDPDSRKVTIRETKVLTLGRYGEWSLGKNIGTLSDDGLSMSGTGYDKWGEYDWSISLEE